MTEWQNRPLDSVYPVTLVDAMVVKIRDGPVANRPVSCAVRVTVDGERDTLGLWVGTGGGREGLAAGPDRDHEPRRQGGPHRGVGRADRGARVDHRDLARGDSSDVRAAPDPQHVPVRIQVGLAGDRRGPATGLPSGDRGRRAAAVRRVRREVGPPISSDHQALGIGVGGVRAVLAVR